MKKIIYVFFIALIITSCNSRKCKLDGCNNEGKGWLTTIEGGCTGAPCRPVGAKGTTLVVEFPFPSLLVEQEYNSTIAKMSVNIFFM